MFGRNDRDMMYRFMFHFNTSLIEEDRCFYYVF
jgi:hypothetical protein